MIDMYRRARAQYVWHSGCSVLNIKGEVISKAEVSCSRKNKINCGRVE